MSKSKQTNRHPMQALRRPPRSLDPKPLDFVHRFIDDLKPTVVAGGQRKMMRDQRASTSSLGQSYREKVRIHADIRLAVTTCETDPAVVSRTLRRFLKIEDQRLKTAHYLGRPGCETAAARSFVLDIVVGHAFRHAAPVIQ